MMNHSKKICGYYNKKLYVYFFKIEKVYGDEIYIVLEEKKGECEIRNVNCIKIAQSCE